MVSVFKAFEISLMFPREPYERTPCLSLSTDIDIVTLIDRHENHDIVYLTDVDSFNMEIVRNTEVRTTWAPFDV
jgi:hypothetical protein